MVAVELAPDVLDEPAQAAVGALISGTSRGFGPLRRDPLPWRTFSYAEPAQLPAHVVQVEHADLVDPQADVGLQPGGGVVPGGQGELPAGGQLPPPP